MFPSDLICTMFADFRPFNTKVTYMAKNQLTSSNNRKTGNNRPS